MVTPPGLSFTVEPGMYIPNFGGLRVEEKVAVTQDGVDALTAHPRGPRSSWPNPDVLLGEPGKATKTGTSPIMTSSVVYRSVV